MKLVEKRKITTHQGTGYIQGTGIDLNVEFTRILFFRFVSNVTISHNGEWLRKLKVRIAEDEKQQDRERSRK